MLPARQRDLEVAQRCCCSQEREQEAPALRLRGLRRGPADVGFPSPAEPQRSLPAITSTGVVADRWPDPPGQVLIPIGPWVTLSVLARAPCALAALTAGGDARSAASTLGSPLGNSRLLSPLSRLPARRASQHGTLLPGEPFWLGAYPSPWLSQGSRWPWCHYMPLIQP